MKVKKIIVIIFTVLSVAVNTLILVESFINGEGSGAQSIGFTKMIGEIIKVIFPNSYISLDEEYLHGFIRKLFGHFLLFGVSGTCTTLALLANIMIITKKKMVIYTGISSGFGASIAFLSEFIQSFTPGRAGVLTDVLIDSNGYLLFTIFVFFMIFIFSKNDFPSDKNKEKLDAKSEND